LYSNLIYGNKSLGIWVTNGSKHLIRSNTIFLNSSGLGPFSYSRILSNNIYANGEGLQLANHNIVDSNRMDSNDSNALWLYHGSGNTIIGNTLSNQLPNGGGYGAIHIGGSDNNLFVSN